MRWLESFAVLKGTRHIGFNPAQAAPPYCQPMVRREVRFGTPAARSPPYCSADDNFTLYTAPSSAWKG